MNLFEAVRIVEGETLATEVEQIAAWQYLIDSGVVWTLQGSYGRMALHMIEEGLCCLPERRATA